MTLRRMRELLLPGSAERDEWFHQEICRLSHAGLGTIGAVEIAVPILLHFARLRIAPSLAARVSVVFLSSPGVACLV